MNGTTETMDKDSEMLMGLQSNLDDLFLLLMGGFIVFMQAGFAFLEAGAVRSKNTIAILIKNISDMFIGSLSFWACGFALAFGESSPFIGLNFFFLQGLDASRISFFFFQATFAATCATIVSGAIAERADYTGYALFSIVITATIYPVQAHWCWGPDGWLATRGFYDFAGSGVVHLTGGVAAAVACGIIGRRQMDPSKDLEATNTGVDSELRGHSKSLSVLGFFILTFGFLAFNGGSVASISNERDGQKVALIYVNTLMACGSGGLAAMAAAMVSSGQYSLEAAINGGIAGMVSICASCDDLEPIFAMVTALIGSLIHLFVSLAMRKNGLDDPLDAAAVHAGAGAWGLMAGPVFRRGDGFLSTGAWPPMLLWNAVGTLTLALWSACASFLILFALNNLGMLRVSEECERVGLDLHKHGDQAYPEWPSKDAISVAAQRGRGRMELAEVKRVRPMQE